MTPADLLDTLKAQIPRFNVQMTDDLSKRAADILRPGNADPEALHQEFVDRYTLGMANSSQGCAVAQGLIFIGRKREAKVGRLLLQWLANMGEPEAKYLLAKQLVTGGTVKEDLHGAIALCKDAIASEAEEKSLIGACSLMLGDSISSVWGQRLFAPDTKLYEEANEVTMHYARACEMGEARAAFKAGAFQEGSCKGLPQRPNFQRAMHFYSIGTQLSDRSCKTNLGVIHLADKCSESNRSIGQHLLTEAALEGDMVAAIALHILTGLHKRGESSVGLEWRVGLGEKQPLMWRLVQAAFPEQERCWPSYGCQPAEARGPSIWAEGNGVSQESIRSVVHRTKMALAVHEAAGWHKVTQRVIDWAIDQLSNPDALLEVETRIYGRLAK